MSEADEEYQKILQTIMDKLAPGRVTPKSSDEAFQLLAKASQYPDDARLCDAIANQVYSAWLARKNGDRVNAANRSLEDERKRLEWNARITAKENASTSLAGDLPRARMPLPINPSSLSGTWRCSRSSRALLR